MLVQWEFLGPLGDSASLSAPSVTHGYLLVSPLLCGDGFCQGTRLKPKYSSTSWSWYGLMFSWNLSLSSFCVKWGRRLVVLTAILDRCDFFIIILLSTTCGKIILCSKVKCCTKEQWSLFWLLLKRKPLANLTGSELTARVLEANILCKTSGRADRLEVRGGRTKSLKSHW